MNRDDLRRLARRASEQPFFLGNIFSALALRDNIGNDDIATQLGCSPETLDKMKLCRAPLLDDAGFLGDVRRISDSFDVDFMQLMSIIKDAAITARMSGHARRDSGWLMAARDREPQDDD